MHDRPIWPGPADGLETGGKKTRAFTAQRQKMRGNLMFLHAGGCTAVQPAQEARHDRPVLDMGAARAIQLGLVLQRLHRRHLAALRHQLDRRLGQRGVKLFRQAVRVKHHFRAFGIAGAQVDQIAKLRQRHDRHLIGKVTLHHRGQPGHVAKKDQPVLAMVQGEEKIDRGIGQIGTTDVHQPVHGIGAADHQRVAPGLGQPRVKIGKLVGHAGTRHAVRHAERA